MSGGTDNEDMTSHEAIVQRFKEMRSHVPQLASKLNDLSLECAVSPPNYCQWGSFRHHAPVYSHLFSSGESIARSPPATFLMPNHACLLAKSHESVLWWRQHYSTLPGIGQPLLASGKGCCCQYTWSFGTAVHEQGASTHWRGPAH